MSSEMDSGSTAFIIVCAALVNFMTPGLAFFYGGLVRQQNVLTIIMQNFVAMGLVTMIWVVWGFSLCFGKSGKMFGSPATYAMLSNIEDRDGEIPGLAFARASAPETIRRARETAPRRENNRGESSRSPLPRRAARARPTRRVPPAFPPQPSTNSPAHARVGSCLVTGCLMVTCVFFGRFFEKRFFTHSALASKSRLRAD